MPHADSPLEILSMASIILVLLMNCHRSFILDNNNNEEDEAYEDDFFPHMCEDRPIIDLQAISEAAVHQWTLWNSITAMDEELGYWMKPRSTAWFSKFLLEEYDDARWIQIFRMSKQSVLSLSALLAPAIKKRDTRFRQAVPVVIRLGCTLFKLCQGASLLICSELFVVGRSTVSIMLREVVSALNVALRKEIDWPRGERILSIAADFQQLCGLPSVAGAIDGTHFAIAKPRVGAADYFYFKSGGFTITCQAVVDASKRFLDLNVGMPGSTNDARVLRRSALYHRGQQGTLWEGRPCIQGFSPYLLGDAGYPLLPWLMAPHRPQGGLSMSQRLFNRKLSKGRAVVENAFAMLKINFQELNQKSDLHVSFMPDVVVACGLLHNVLLKQTHGEVERHLETLAAERLHDQSPAAPVSTMNMTAGGPNLPNQTSGRQKRDELGVFLSLQRIAPY